MKQIKIGKYLINSKRTFITFEAGATHNGLKSAKQLIDIASDAGQMQLNFNCLIKKILYPIKNKLLILNI